MSNEETLTDWNRVIKESSAKANEVERLWRESIGQPRYTYFVDECHYGAWKIDGRIFTTRILKSGPSMHHVQEYSPETIGILHRLMTDPK
mgnify:CR=1 FL=1